MIGFYSRQGSAALANGETADPESYDVSAPRSGTRSIIRCKHLMRHPKNLSETMERAILRAAKSGCVVAGDGLDERGRVERHNPATLRALARMGLLELYVHQDGGCAGRFTVAGVNHATTLGYVVRRFP